MVRSVVRCLALLLAVLAGCGSPYFPLNQPDRPAAVSEAAWRSTVLFTDGTFLCGAVVVAPGTALTARHCVREKFTGGLLVHPDGRAFVVLGARVAENADIALLSFAPRAAGAPMGELAEIGQPGYVLGYGCSGGRKLQARRVAFVGRFTPSSSPDELMLDVWEGRACRGDSGGGVFDASGRLVGITVRIADAKDGLELLYTVPVELVSGMVQSSAEPGA